MPRVHYVKKARKDNPVAKKGEPYYWWKFAYCGKTYSKTRPRPSQLTRSEFYSTLYSIQEELADSIAVVRNLDDFESAVENAASEARGLMEETQGKLDNMPYQLQGADTGQLMQERIDALDAWADELDSVMDNVETRDIDDDQDEWADNVRDEIMAVEINL